MPGEPSSIGAGYALDAIIGRGVPARTMYLALLTAAPTRATTTATMAELLAAGYSRQAVSWTIPSGNPRVTANSNSVTFGPFTADPPAVTHCALVSEQVGTGGDFVWFWSNTSIDPIINDTITVAVGALTMQT